MTFIKLVEHSKGTIWSLHFQEKKKKEKKFLGLVWALASTTCPVFTSLTRATPWGTNAEMLHLGNLLRDIVFSKAKIRTLARFWYIEWKTKWPYNQLEFRPKLFLCFGGIKSASGSLSSLCYVSNHPYSSASFYSSQEKPGFSSKKDTLFFLQLRLTYWTQQISSSTHCTCNIMLQAVD